MPSVVDTGMVSALDLQQLGKGQGATWSAVEEGLATGRPCQALLQKKGLVP
jgi:hypothetical protein